MSRRHSARRSSERFWDVFDAQMIVRSLPLCETKSMKRDRRRRDLGRMKRRARKLYPMVPNNIKYANHLAVCSGACCGNERRWFGEKTIQEKRADEAFRQAS